MTSLIFKVSDKISTEMDLVQEAEGLGNRTATLAFLVKYYFLTQKNSLDQSISLLNSLLDRVDTATLSSPEEQLSDL